MQPKAVGPVEQAIIIPITCTAIPNIGIPGVVNNMGGTIAWGYIMIRRAWRIIAATYMHATAKMIPGTAAGMKATAATTLG